MSRINLYFPNKFDKLYEELKLEIKDLWFKKHGESLTIGNILLKSLLYFRDALLENEKEKNDNKRQTLHKYSRTRS
jgi:hypothetical protein